LKRALAVLLLCGCGLGTQALECKKYLACLDVVMPGASASIVSSYGPTGNCWSTNQVAADGCISACRDATASQAMQHPDVAECQ
jgi:hypothetical protein